MRLAARQSTSAYLGCLRPTPLALPGSAKWRTLPAKPGGRLIRATGPFKEPSRTLAQLAKLRNDDPDDASHPSAFAPEAWRVAECVVGCLVKARWLGGLG